MTTEAKKCGCGRSPTGLCEGYHKMTNEEYQSSLKAREIEESKQLLKE